MRALPHAAAARCWHPRPHRRCWPSRPDLGERWPFSLGGDGGRRSPEHVRDLWVPAL